MSPPPPPPRGAPVRGCLPITSHHDHDESSGRLNITIIPDLPRVILLLLLLIIINIDIDIDIDIVTEP